jgi:hypothetical protein
MPKTMMTYSEFCASRGLKDYSQTTNALVLGGQEDLLCTCKEDGDENCYCKYVNDATERGEVDPDDHRFLQKGNP